MKKAILKKVAIGVGVSLASTAVVALAAGLFNESGGFKGNTCAHETRTKTSAAPTCLVGGVTDMIRCLDCGEIVVHGEDIPPTGHTGEVGEECSICGQFIYGTHANANIYARKEVTKNETVAGNWYRIYDGGSMRVSEELVGSDCEPTVGFYCNFSMSQGFISYAGETTGARVVDMPYVITEDYIDLYLAPGEYKLSVNGGSITFEITEETTITSMSGSVYRLVFESNEAAASSEE